MAEMPSGPNLSPEVVNFSPMPTLRGGTLSFFLITLALCSWHLDAGRNANTISRAAMVAALVQDGSLRIDAYHELTADKAVVDGHYYSEKAPLPALVVTPFWWAANKLQLITPGENGLLTDGLLRLGGFLCASFPLALIITLVYAQLREQETVWPAAWMALLPFLGSFLFVYSGSFHGHLLAALLLLLAWRMRTNEHAVLSGAFASAAVLCEFSLFVFPLIWLVQDVVQRRWSFINAQVFGGLPGVMLLLVLNLMVTRHPLVLPYADVAEHVDVDGTLGLGMPTAEGLFGLLFGSFRGLLPYAPVTVLCLVALWPRLRTLGLRGIALHPLVLPSIALVIMISGHSMWWGGWAFGPRHLTAVAVLLLAAGLPLVPVRPWAKWSFILLSIAGLVVAFATKSTTGYSLPTEARHPFRELVLPSVLERSWTTMQWPTAIGFSGAMGTFLFLLALIFVLRWFRMNSAPNTAA